MFFFGLKSSKIEAYTPVIHMYLYCKGFENNCPHNHPHNKRRYLVCYLFLYYFLKCLLSSYKSVAILRTGGKTIIKGYSSLF